MKRDDRQIAAGLPDALRQWYEQIIRRPLHTTGKKEDIADRNLLYLAMTGPQRRLLRSKELEKLLFCIVGVWRDRLATGVTEPWAGYAWNDAMAGQLRISACPAATLADLPFACRLREVSASAIVAEFLGDKPNIPFSDLDVVNGLVDVDGGDTAALYTLDIWWQPLHGETNIDND